MRDAGWLCVLAVSVALFASPAPAAPIEKTYGIFDLTYHNSGDSHGGQTGDTNWTATQQASVEAMIDMWDGLIDDASPPRNIDFHLMWYDLAGTTLGSSSNYYTASGGTAYSYAERLWRAGVNPGAQIHDIFIVFDSGTSWNYGSGSPGGGTYDLRSVTAHEIGHSLGFGSSYGLGSPGGDNWWTSGITAWDSYLRDDSGNAPSAGSTGSPGNFNQTDNPVWFTGSNAVAYNSGNAAIYAPTTYSSGSSLTHLDESTFSSALMSPQIGAAEMIRQPTSLELEVMKDLGWTIVPEPSAALLFLLGSAAIYAAARRRRRRLMPCRYGWRAGSGSPASPRSRTP